MNPATTLMNPLKPVGTLPTPFGDKRLPREAIEAAAAIHRHWPVRPQVGLILGTGLGHLAARIEAEAAVSYRQIPHFPRSTALSHKGQLVCGRLAGSPVVAMEGRCHYYEGYPLEQLVLPVYTLCALGVELLILSNASGGLNSRFASGDVMVIEDHLDFMFAGAPRLGSPRGLSPRRGRLSFYDRALQDQALAIARKQEFPAHRGVYAAMTGPNYETRAEYRFLRRVGADVVGMSTVPEAIAAAQCGLRTLALSTVTNVAKPDSPRVVKAADVVAAAALAEPKVSTIAMEVVANPWPSDAPVELESLNPWKPR